MGRVVAGQGALVGVHDQPSSGNVADLSVTYS
jgi:hypothetical protein